MKYQIVHHPTCGWHRYIDGFMLPIETFKARIRAKNGAEILRWKWEMVPGCGADSQRPIYGCGGGGY